jgi:hypothetical protein
MVITLKYFRWLRLCSRMELLYGVSLLFGAHPDGSFTPWSLSYVPTLVCHFPILSLSTEPFLIIWTLVVGFLAATMLSVVISKTMSVSSPSFLTRYTPNLYEAWAWTSFAFNSILSISILVRIRCATRHDPTRSWDTAILTIALLPGSSATVEFKGWADTQPFSELSSNPHCYLGLECLGV